MKTKHLLLAFVLLAVGRNVFGAPPDLPIAVRFGDWIMSNWPDPTKMTNKGWEYNNGIILQGLSKVYEKNRDPRYLAYIKQFVDAYVKEDGSVDLGPEHNLDTLQPGILLLFLYEQTGDEKYHKTADYVRKAFDSIPKNADGGFWHKKRYPDEMWVDGIYMGEPFLVKYGQLFGKDPACFDTAVFQTTLCARHTQDPATGLLRHAWDCDRNAAWADPQTGVSPEVWSRGMGWFAMALVDILPYLPTDHSGRRELIDSFQKLAAGLKKTQDPKTGLWYQVVDKGDQPDNWHETSGSGMFVYALKIGMDRGYIGREYRDVVAKGWSGLKSKVSAGPDGSPIISDAVEGMGVQTNYANYLNKKRLQNSAHGLCAILLAASEMELGTPKRRRQTD
ncbi:MAG: glycoside hydrolase family 88 protein [Acidobacteria bacterium]|nr:MAG: glycoside hydrolase family 88 protein [Acidobacteriota bacterium]